MKWSALLLFSLFFTACLPMASALQGFQSLSSYGVIINESVPSLQVFRAHGIDKLPQEQRTAKVIAEKLDMFTCWYYHGKLVQEIHSIRPDVICLLYRNVRAIYNYSDEWQMALDKDWMLKDSSGNLIHSTTWPTVYMADIGNTEYQKWVANWIKGYLDKYGFDGVFSDNGFTALETAYWWEVNAQPINPRTGNLWTTNEIIEAWISFHHEIKRAIGSKLNIANAIFNGERFWKYQTKYVNALSNCEIDGFMSEGLFNWGFTEGGYEGTYYTEEKWKKSLDFMVWLQENYLNQGKIFFPHGRCSQDQIPSGCTTEQMANFIFASLLLGAQPKRIHYLSLQGATLLPEVQNVFKLDLGVPINNYHLVEGTHVYIRDFSKARVLVNPTATSYSIMLGKSYKTLDGQIVDSITLDDHSGVILLSA